MKRIVLLSIMLICAAVFTFTGPGSVYAQSDGSISATVVDAETFITVKETVGGDVLSLYKIRNDRIILVDTVINTSKRAVNLPTRYLQRQEVENR